MNCKSCGANYEDHFERCPYCSAMNPITSLRGVRLRLYKIKEKLSNLVDETYASMNALFAYALKRAFVLVLVCVAFGIACGLLMPDSYEAYSRAYNEELYQDLLIYDALIEELDQAYALKDFEIMESIINDNYSAFSRWSHYDIYLLVSQAKFLESQIDYDSIDEYTLSNALYYLYKPSYFVPIQFDQGEIDVYNEYKKPALEVLDYYGFDEKLGHVLYQECLKDNFISLERLMEVLE